ncbi:M48 family metalloprotease [Nonomuraea polychroma]|uniref:M48 family metalloprotease n=1 Tax=Nonomuraea polychroma TaxID=46176 RepID=UPI003D8F432D
MKTGGGRLDPFVLVSSTTSRFLILILVTLGGSLYLYEWLVTWWWWINAHPEHIRQAACLEEVRAQAATADPIRLVDQYGACVVGVTSQETLLFLALTIVPIVLALLFYAAHPWWIRRRRPVPLDDAEYAVLVDLVAAELPKHRVRLWVDPLQGGVTGQAFGHPRRHHVLLSMGLLLCYRERPEVARAVLRHELAHIRNRDVGIAHVTVAIWWAFLVAVVVPTVVVAAIWVPVTLLQFSWQLPILLGVLWLTRTSVLRAREHHADVRAGDTPERMEDMRAAVTTVSPESGVRLLSTHPRREDRLEALRRPGMLLRLGWGETFAAGLLLGMGFTPVFSGTAGLKFDAVLELRSYFPGLIFGMILSGIVVIAIWRAVLGHLGGGPEPGMRRAAVGVTLGVLAGQIATPILPATLGWTAVLFADPLMGCALALILAVVMVTYLSWAKACAAAWLPRARSPRLVTLGGAAVAGLVIAPWLGYWFQSITLIGRAAYNRGVLPLLLYNGLYNVALLASIGIACCYLLAAGARSPVARERRLRIHLDDADPVVLPRSYSNLRHALIIAVTACAVMAVAGFALRPMMPQGDPTFVTYLTIAMTVGLLTLAAIVIGMQLGSRSQTSFALAHVGTALLVASGPMTLITLVQLASAQCGWAGVFTCMGIGGNGVWLFGRYFITIHAPALLIGMALALPISLMRSREPRLPKRSPLVTVSTTTIGALIVAGCGYAALIGWLPFVGIGPLIAAPYGPDVLAAAREPIRPGTVPRAEACTYALKTLNDVSANSDRELSQRYAISAVRALNRAASSDDAVLRTMANAGFIWLNQGRIDGARDTTGRILHYCTLTLAEGQANPA